MTPTSFDILLVEDDQRLADLTARYFEQNGLSVTIESRGDRALQTYLRTQPRLVILDLNLPGKDGLSVCRELRKNGGSPILILTAKDANIDEVIGLEAGADDYVTKPADPMVLLARTRALLRRAESVDNETATEDIAVGSLRVSASSQQVWLAGVAIELTTQEFELLLVLARSAGRILSRDALYLKTRGVEYDGLDRAIDGRVSRLRRKLGDTGPTPRRIKTVWGKGYLLAPDAWD